MEIREKSKTKKIPVFVKVVLWIASALIVLISTFKLVSYQISVSKQEKLNSLKNAPVVICNEKIIKEFRILQIKNDYFIQPGKNTELDRKNMIPIKSCSVVKIVK